jgi:predicted acyl esterase
VDWRFEDEWSLARTEWTKFYLQPRGGLGTKVPEVDKPETFTQPATYLDPTVYCHRYSTKPLPTDMEVTGPLALYLEASIDIDDTNWVADLVDLDPEGNRQWISSGHLKAGHRFLVPEKSKSYYLVQPAQDPVLVPPGEIVEYVIAMIPTSNFFKRGHRMELIKNQDDLLSRLGMWGVNMCAFMQTVTHTLR